MRPTGRLHLGHLLGALPNWVKLQDDYDCCYCVADLHAMTTRYDNVAGMKKDGNEMVADWIATGIDPERSVIFRQSEVKEHSELALLLGMLVPVSWLTRVPSYKEMVTELGERVATPVSWAIRFSRLRTSSSTRPGACPWVRTSWRTWSWRARSCGASTAFTDRFFRSPGRCSPRRHGCWGSTGAR